MRSLPFAWLAAIMVLFTMPRASAQSGLDLGASIPGVIQFLANDGSGNFTLNMCAKAVHGKCVGRQIQGTAVGYGALAGDNGFYTINGGGVIGTLISGKNCAICRWRLSGPALRFDFSTRPNGGGDLLNGTFRLRTMTQTKNLNGVGFNQDAAIKFNVLGGVLSSYFCNSDTGCVLDLNLQFTTLKPLQTIPKGQSLFQTLSGVLTFSFAHQELTTEN